MSWKKCSNCGHKGHFHKNCTEPKISIGIICFRYNLMQKTLEFLLVQRRFTFAYTDFIRGNYELQDVESIGRLIQLMSPAEKQHILESQDITKFWDEIWTSSDLITERFKRDYQNAVTKFNQLRDNLPTLFEMYPTLPEAQEPSWEFPKGKRDIPTESNVKCACREFHEETGIRSQDYEILFDYSPVNEVFLGNNNVEYKYIYYVAQCQDSQLEPTIDPNNKYQVSEVGDIGWFDWETVKQKIKNWSPNFDKLHQKLETKFSY